MSTQEQYPEQHEQDYIEQDAAPYEAAPYEAAPYEAAPYEAAPYEAAPYEAAPYEEEEAPAPKGSMLPVILSMVAGLIVVGLLGVMMLKPAGGTPQSGVGSSTTSGAPPSGALQIGPNVGLLAPDFTVDRADESGKVTLSSFRGKKPVWVNIWATWCPPCRAEMPEMQKIWNEYKDQVEILGVDFQESPQQVQEFVQNNGYTWTFVLDRDQAVGRAYQATGIPTHAFVDKNGVVQYIIRGGLSREMMLQGLASVGVK